jgi:hypothetical protein
MITYDPLIQRVALKFPGKYRIKRCDKFVYDIDREAIDYHIEFCTKNFTEVPGRVWSEIFNNNNDNPNNWPSIFRKAQKTDRDNEIISKFVGRWREDNVFSSLTGLISRNLPESFGFWKWPYYARLFFSFENRDAMREYLKEYPDLDIEPGFVIYYKGDTKKSFKMFH